MANSAYRAIVAQAAPECQLPTGRRPCDAKQRTLNNTDAWLMAFPTKGRQCMSDGDSADERSNQHSPRPAAQVILFKIARMDKNVDRMSFVP
jgi:hypothetical protein